MNWKSIERIVAAIVFGYALLLYILTVAPTASFWDSGEFIAIANRLQVSHPPGAPFYMLVGRLFSMFVPVAYVALAVNMVSVLSSALTILLTHLIIVRLVREWQGPADSWTSIDRLTALFGGIIGACTFAASDSFWFNAVEAEVYAMSMFFTAAVVWLILKWREQAHIEEAHLAGGGQHPFGLASNRYLILIAYMFGLAIGVHLLNLLAIFFIALIVFYTEFERPSWTTKQRWTGIVLTGVVASAAFLLVYPFIIQVLPGIVGDSGAPLLVMLLILGAVIGGLYYTHKKHMQAANLVMLCITMILIGYSTYALIFIRSASNPPIDENDPETVEAVVSYLKREQYGSTPILKGSTYDNATGQIEEREVWFPRRYSVDPNHVRLYRQYDSDSEFFWKYQVGHMYMRYFLWNFVGKASDEQDAPFIVTHFDEKAKQYLFQTPSEHASQNAFYALPLLLGLIGAAYHFMRDWRRALSVALLFFITGLGIIVYLNQSPMQPRERDYSYVASFFAFTLWVGIGATGILQLVAEALRDRLQPAALQGSLYALGGILFLAVPMWMMVEGYDDHDRSGRYVAPDYAHNMLMSLEDQAVVFTNGDNDTFPLWYLQEVEGVRQDVRVANLSLLNTPWYVRQLKNQSSRASEPLPITMNEKQIRDLTIVPWKPRDVSLKVDKNKLLRNDSEVYFPNEDTSLIQSPMTWFLEGRPYPFDPNINLLYAADQVSLNMLMTNAQQDWKRPIYIAVTVSPDGQLGLQNYFQLEGQAYRIVPIEHEEPLGRVVPEITLDRLRQFKFRGLSDPSVYYDENIRRMIDNYRNVFSHAAQTLADQGQKTEAIELLDWFMEEVPFETIPGDERSFLFMAQAYGAAGDSTRSVEIMQKAEPVVLHRLGHARSQRELELTARYVQLIRIAYLDAQDFDAASAFSSRIAEVLKDSTYRESADDIRRRYQQSIPDTDAAQPPGS